MSGSGKTNCHWAVLLGYWLCLQGIILYCNPRLQLQKCICSRLLTKHLLLLINAILVSDIKSFFDLTVICLCLYVYILFLQINICTFFLTFIWTNLKICQNLISMVPAGHNSSAKRFIKFPAKTLQGPINPIFHSSLSKLVSKLYFKLKLLILW